MKDAMFFLYSIACGMFMAFIYDCIRLFRRICRHGIIWMGFEDGIYWILCFFISFYLLYYVNNGVIRLSGVLGAGCGMGLYYSTLGRVFVKAGYAVFNMIMLPFRLVKNRLTKLTFQFTMMLRRCVNNLGRGERKHAKQETCISSEEK